MCERPVLLHLRPTQESWEHHLAPPSPYPGNIRLHAETPPVAHSVTLSGALHMGTRNPGATRPSARAARDVRSIHAWSDQCHNALSAIVRDVHSQSILDDHIRIRHS
jgi:hypothetical protein